jgi:hypothetical protein
VNNKAEDFIESNVNAHEEKVQCTFDRPVWNLIRIELPMNLVAERSFRKNATIGVWCNKQEMLL